MTYFLTITMQEVMVDSRLRVADLRYSVYVDVNMLGDITNSTVRRHY